MVNYTLAGISAIMAVIAIVILINLLPTLDTAITTANQTGINGTILGFVPLGLIIGALVMGFKAVKS